MQIREALWSDLPDVLKLGRMHYAATDLTSDIKYDDEAFKQSLEAMQYSEDCFIIVAVDEGECVGIFALQIATAFFSHDRAARELFLYIRPEFRGQHVGVGMIRMGEAWALSKGFKNIILGIHSLSPPHVAETYIRYGYRAVQTEYLKRLT